jgi:hypothetical protein
MLAIYLLEWGHRAPIEKSQGRHILGAQVMLLKLHFFRIAILDQRENTVHFITFLMYFLVWTDEVMSLNC